MPTENEATAERELTHCNVMGRIAIIVFGDKNNVTDEQCVERIAEAWRRGKAIETAGLKLVEWVNSHEGMMPHTEEFAAIYGDFADALGCPPAAPE